MSQEQFGKKNNIIEQYGLLAMDMCAIAIAYVLAYYLRYRVTNVLGNEAHKTVLLCLILACVVYSLFLEWNKNITSRGYFVEFVTITKYNFVLLIIAAMLVFVFRQGEFYSRLVFGYFAIINEILTYVFHAISKKVLRDYLRSNHSKIRVMIVSEWSGVETVIKNLRGFLPVNYEISSLAIMDKDLGGSYQYDIPVVAGRSDLLEVAKGLPLDEVFINLPNENINLVRGMIKDIESMGAVCHYNIDIVDWSNKESSVSQFGNYTVITYAINRMDYRRLMIKRLMDILGSLLGLCVTAVVFPFIALAIKVDSKGPVLFAQTRIGKNGRRFKIYKFRSMYVDAEDRKKELVNQNEMQGLMFKIEDDPRITRVGSFLRKTSLDELPQFYNILVGEMSLVGTRPPTEDEFEQYSLYYRRRLCMTPGLTGMWQISGRSDITDFNDVVKLDLEYIDNWSITLDIKIILQTIGVVIFRKGSR